MGLFRASVDLAFGAGDGGGTNTWSLRTLSSEGSTTEVAALMDLVKGFYEDLVGIFPTDYTMTWDGTVRELATPTPSLLGGATPWVVTGNGGTSYGPAPAMVCASWKSSLATRRGRGRTFLGPVAAGVWEAADGTITAANLTNIRAAVAALVSASLADTNGAIVVFSEVDQIGRDIIAGTVTDQAAVLRSRR